MKPMPEARDSGFEFLQMGRATIQDPVFVKKLQSGDLTQSPCDRCNRCVAAMDSGGVYCISNEVGFYSLTRRVEKNPAGQ